MKKVVLKNVKIGYRNFSGRPSRYNLEGNRNFFVIITEKQMEELKSIGCSVKVFRNKDGGEIYGLMIRVLGPSNKLLSSFPSLKPDITVKIKGQKDVPIDLDKINVMDSLTIYGANLTINIVGKYKLSYLSCGEFKVSKNVHVTDLFRAMDVL